MKVGVVGTGLVGATAAYAMLLRGSCSELVLVDRNAERARAEAADISHAAPVSHAVRVMSGDYAALQGARVVIIAAGVNQQPEESRLELLARNAEVFREVVPSVVQHAGQAVLLVATNPVDVMTDLTARLAGPEVRVIGSGTVLDSARFRMLIAEHAGVDPQHVHGYVLGEHGDTEVLAWSTLSVAGLRLQEFLLQRDIPWSDELREDIERRVRYAASEIIAGKRATYYGVGASLARIAETIVHDRRAVLTVSAPSAYGVSLSLPRILGGEGVIETLQPPLSPAEHAALEHSASVLLEAAAHY